MFGLQAALPSMERGSAVVLMGSIADAAGISPYATYAATKRRYALMRGPELAPLGIRANVVVPGPTDTAMMSSVPEERRAALIAQIPLGRMAKPEEVAAATLFLLSDDASYIEGAKVCVGGGMRQV